MNKCVVLFGIYLFLSFTCKPDIDSRRVSNSVCFVDKTNGIYQKVDIYPSYPRGDIEFVRFVLEELAPKTSVNSFKYDYKILLVIGVNGEIQQTKINNKEYGDLDDDEKTIYDSIQKSEKWNPGICNGEKVKAYFSIPLKVNFSK